VTVIQPQESPSNSVSEQNSNERLNPIETTSFSNFPIHQDIKYLSSSIETNVINNSINKYSEYLYSGDIQSKFKNYIHFPQFFLEIESKLNESDIISEEHKFPLNIIVTNQNLNLLKNMKGNIFIEIENKYHCSISKRVEVFN